MGRLAREERTKTLSRKEASKAGIRKILLLRNVAVTKKGVTKEKMTLGEKKNGSP